MNALTLLWIVPAGWMIGGALGGGGAAWLVGRWELWEARRNRVKREGGAP